MHNKIQTYKVADLSTSHMTRADNDLLTARHEDPDFPVIVRFTEFGWLLYVSSIDDPDIQEIWRDAGLSQTVIQACLAANRAGCKYADFDCDGIIYEDLPKADW